VYIFADVTYNTSHLVYCIYFTQMQWSGKSLLRLSSLLEWRRKCRWRIIITACRQSRQKSCTFVSSTFERKKMVGVNPVTLKRQIVNRWNEWLRKMGRSSKSRCIFAGRWVLRRENFLLLNLCYRHCFRHLNDERRRHLYKASLSFTREDGRNNLEINFFYA